MAGKGASSTGETPIEVRPATSFDDVATMVGPKSRSANVCWCLSYRLTRSAENRELRGEARGAKVRELMASGPPGVLAYDGDEVVGWAAVHPRADTSFATNRRIPHVGDDEGVWSVWCIRVRPGHRGQGISHALLDGAVAFARDGGATVVEGYPVDNRGRRSTSRWPTSARGGCSNARASARPPTPIRCSTASRGC